MRKKESVKGVAVEGGSSAPQPRTFRIDVPALRLPRVNQVLRWNRWTRAKEVKRVRELVCAYALAGGPNAPLAKACVEITAYGPYQKRDSDGTWFKDVLDAIVARWQIDKATGVRYQRWGMVVDDNRQCIGRARFTVKDAPEYSVVIVVEERGLRRGRMDSALA